MSSDEFPAIKEDQAPVDGENTASEEAPGADAENTEAPTAE